MATTNRIKVNSVRVGDPNLTVTLACDDTGTFPKYVQVTTATVSNANLLGGSEPVTGSTGPNNFPTTVTIQCSFTDSAYRAGQNFGYNITKVSFSDDGVTWNAFTGTYETDGDPWSGSVTSEDFAVADAAGTPPMPKPESRPMLFFQRIWMFFLGLFGVKTT
jgi:hypothetical protein